MNTGWNRLEEENHEDMMVVGEKEKGGEEVNEREKWLLQCPCRYEKVYSMIMIMMMMMMMIMMMMMMMMMIMMIMRMVVTTMMICRWSAY